MKTTSLLSLVLLLAFTFTACGEETESTATSETPETVETAIQPTVTINSALLHRGLTEVDINPAKHELLNKSLILYNGTLTEDRIFTDGKSEKITLEGVWVTKAQFIIDDFPAQYLSESQVGECVSEAADNPCWYLYLEKSDATGTTVVSEELPEDLQAYGAQIEAFWEEVMNRE